MAAVQNQLKFNTFATAILARSRCIRNEKPETQRHTELAKTFKYLQIIITKSKYITISSQTSLRAIVMAVVVVVDDTVERAWHLSVKMQPDEINNK